MLVFFSAVLHIMIPFSSWTCSVLDKGAV